jgi:nucleoside-diphosphate-sugar epimerase
MNILVTGGSGYIGSVLVPALIADGHRVSVMDLIQPIAGDWTEQDIFDNPVTAADLRRTDAVIHLAAVVGDEACHEQPGRAVETNFLATKYLARACREADVRLIFASTCSVYGVKRGLSTEETEPEPYSVYGLTKFAAEKDVLNAGGAVFRLGTAYGISPHMSYILVINEFVRLAKTKGAVTVFGGDQMRPFLEINSAVRAFCAGVKSNIAGQVINIVDANIALGGLGKIVGEIFGCTVRTITEIIDRRSYQVDNTKAVRVLDFKPKPLKDGIEAMKSQYETVG